jgi:hypothetical protein
MMRKESANRKKAQTLLEQEVLYISTLVAVLVSGAIAASADNPGGSVP